MAYVFSPVDRPSLPVQGSGSRFPLHRIYCIGRNYAEHSREMGSDPRREAPCIFSKPADAAVDASGASAVSIAYPPRTGELHHEIELVVALGRGGNDISAAQAREHVFGFAAGVDLTRRDLQQEAGKQGLPWDTAKGFDGSAPVSAIHALSETGWPERGGIWLKVNGETRQNADIADMIWNPGEVIAELSTFFRLQAGDLIFTGTPAGVGPLQRGDRVEAGVDGVAELCFRIE